MGRIGGMFLVGCGGALRCLSSDCGWLIIVQPNRTAFFFHTLPPSGNIISEFDD